MFCAVVPSGWEPSEYYARLNELWGNEELDHVAIYPYSANMGAGCYSDRCTFMVQLPNVQQGIPGTFDPSCWVALARSKNDHFTFSYPFGGIKFSVVSENVSKVTITCGEQYKADNFGNKKEYVSIYNDGSLYVTWGHCLPDSCGPPRLQRHPRPPCACSPLPDRSLYQPDDHCRT